MFIYSALRAIDWVEYSPGETVQAYVLPASMLGVLPQEDTYPLSITTIGRAYLPYPPGNFKINDELYPATISGRLRLSWAHRSRAQQTAYIVRQDEGNIGPEGKVSYLIELYNENGVLVRTVKNKRGTKFVWRKEKANSGLGRLNNSITIKLWSRRLGSLSGQYHMWTVSRDFTVDDDPDDVPEPTNLHVQWEGPSSATWAWDRGGSAGNTFELLVSPTNSMDHPDAYAIETGTAESHREFLPAGTWFAWVSEVEPDGSTSDWVGPQMATVGG
ncbi:hypothetical protein [Methylomagnum ishizawai]|uniref:hypothetical protein n=1 Tax=Methylomagnum ishizawai TaxID=1760988 RepID=UPI000A150C86|nr:hypothetical protein [Methylomagnum ishizawai]